MYYVCKICRWTAAMATVEVFVQAVADHMADHMADHIQEPTMSLPPDPALIQEMIDTGAIICSTGGVA